MAKLQTRKTAPQVGAGTAGQMPGPTSAGMQNAPGMTPTSARPPDLATGGPQTHHHGSAVNSVEGANGMFHPM